MQVATDYLEDAIEFLQRVYVGNLDEDRLVRTIRLLQQDIKKRRKK